MVAKHPFYICPLIIYNWSFTHKWYGMDPAKDVIRVTRVGHKDGTTLAEMKNEDMKVKMMKAKKCLLNHSSA